MRYKGYTGKVEYDDEARVFHGEVLDTRDVITFQGSSVRELQEAFCESIYDHIAFCKTRVRNQISLFREESSYD